MLSQELRHARLLFTRSPGVSAAAILALALGIAGNSVMFSIVSAVLLKPLPYPEAGRMVSVLSVLRSDAHFVMTVSIPDFLDWREQSRTLEGWTICSPREISAAVGKDRFTVAAVYISNEGIPMTGVHPVAGSLMPRGRDDDPSRVYISRTFWTRHFQSDPAVQGKTFLVEGNPRTIQAVLPDGFNLGSRYVQADIWIPMPIPSQYGRGDHLVFALARLRPGVRLDQAQAELSRIGDQLSKKYAESDGLFRIRVDRYQQSLTQEVSDPLWLLLGAVLVVQLIVCTNVAGLLLSRAAERAQQTAIRIALGASLSQIARQCLAEGLSLSLTAGLIGAGAGWMLLGLNSFFGPRLPITNPVSFDWRVAGFAFSLSLLTGVLASLAPWWQARFIHAGELLREGSRSTAGLQRRRMLRAFAALEIALSLVLLIVASLLATRSLALNKVDLGFDAENLYSMDVNVPRERHVSDPELSAFFSRLLAQVQSAPGFEGASLISLFTPNWGNNSTIFPGGKEDPKTAHQFIEYRTVSEGYFGLMGLRFVQGRAPVNADLQGPDMPLAINQTAARLYWPDGKALGRRVKWGDPGSEPWYRVVGVYADIRNAGAQTPIRPEGDFLYQERPERRMFIAVRSRLPKTRIADALSSAVFTVDPAVSASIVETMTERLDRSLATIHFQAFALSAFSVFSLILAIVGVYSVMSYIVSQRTMEIGIRLAIGADPFRSLRLILWEGFQLAFAAATAGLVIAVAVVRLLPKSPSFMIEPHPWPILISYVLIILAATLACFLPARRAALVDPMVALRPAAPSSFRASLRRLRQVSKLLKLPLDRSRETIEFDRQWLARLAETTGQASSISDVLNQALASLRGAVGAESAALYVKSPDNSFVCTSSDGIEQPASLISFRADAFVVRRLRNLVEPLVFTEADFQAWRHFAATADAETRTHREEELAALHAARTVLVVPVWLKGDLLALLSFGPRADLPYSVNDFQPLQIAASQLAFIVENGRLLARVTAEERTRQELALAARVQRRLFPEHALNFAQIELAGECQPARTIGGDYYDFLELPNGQIGIALADVAGKGIAAALLTSVIQASVRSLAPDQDRRLSDLVVRINQLLYQSTESNSYATFFYAQFDPAACRLTYVNAGHNPPYFLRVAGPNTFDGAASRSLTAVAEPAIATITELAACGPIIGLLKTVAYQEERLDLRKGDLLVAYTDGIPEALNGNEEEYGEDRLRELAQRLFDRSADEIRQAILADVRSFIADAAQYDDMTVLVMKVH